MENVLKNWWYMAGWANEITRTPMRRILLNQPVVIFRLQDGGVAALEDRCAHRNFPLSMGCLIGDRLRCGYHGLTYDAAGRAVYAPGQPQPPRNGDVRAFPLIEKHGVVWIWMGKAELANAALLPPLGWLDQEEWRTYQGGYLHLKARHSLLTENLLDGSHVGYLHVSTIGGEDAEGHSNAVTEITPFEFGLRRRRQMPATKAPFSYRRACPSLNDVVDRWNYSEMRPGFYQNYTGAKNVGTGALEGDEVGGFQSRSMQAIVPETDHTTHYFFGGASPKSNFRPEKVEDALAAVLTTLDEDRVALEAIEANEAFVGDRPTVNLANDKSAMQWRFAIKQMLSAEKNELARSA